MDRHLLHVVAVQGHRTTAPDDADQQEAVASSNQWSRIFSLSPTRPKSPFRTTGLGCPPLLLCGETPLVGGQDSGSRRMGVAVGFTVVVPPVTVPRRGVRPWFINQRYEPIEQIIWYGFHDCFNN